MLENTVHPHSRALGIWLLLCAFSVYIMVIVGGITRLTQSGLSMVEWEPIMGILPPLGEAAWLEVFEKYRQSPEYLKINAGMSLAAFKSIFWWEYGHRVLGRAIGMIYLLPLLWFFARGYVPASWRMRLIGLFFLGGAQGLMGWYMVMSGLVDVPHVSQYRLTAHLTLAIIIFSFMWWFALSFLRGSQPATHASRRYQRWCLVSIGAVLLMIVSGGFVAGTKAGFIMNTFPTMNGQWVPDGVMAMTPAWRNIFENAVTVQFVHRCLALVVIVVLSRLVWLARHESEATGSVWVLLALIAQVALGISALLLHVPVWLGAAHQAGAVTLLAVVLYSTHLAMRPS